MTQEELHKLIADAQQAKIAKMKKRNYSLNISRTEGLYIGYRLKAAGTTCADIARDLNCKRGAVTQVVNGEAHSHRIENAVAKTLHYRSWNEMVQNIRDRQLAEVVA